MSQQQIADCLGMTVVHVNRLLRQLREAAVLVLSKRAFTVVDVDRLVALGAGIRDEFEVAEGASDLKLRSLQAGIVSTR